MRFDIGKIYTIVLTDGYKFSAKCVEQDADSACFESSKGHQTWHRTAEIITAKVVR